MTCQLKHIGFILADHQGHSRGEFFRRWMDGWENGCQRDYEVESRANAKFTFYPDLSIHECDARKKKSRYIQKLNPCYLQLKANGQSQACPSQRMPNGTINLSIFFEDVLQVLLWNPNTSISHRKMKFLLRCCENRNNNLPLISEFHRIR